MTIQICAENHVAKILELSETEFATLWSTLGLPAQWCGEMYPHKVLQRLEALEPASLKRTKEKDGGWSRFGIKHSDISGHLRTLKNICELAGQEETMIYWGTK